MVRHSKRRMGLLVIASVLAVLPELKVKVTPRQLRRATRRNYRRAERALRRGKAGLATLAVQLRAGLVRALEKLWAWWAAAKRTGTMKVQATRAWGRTLPERVALAFARGLEAAALVLVERAEAIERHYRPAKPAAPAPQRFPLEVIDVPEPVVPWGWGCIDLPEVVAAHAVDLDMPAQLALEYRPEQLAQGAAVEQLEGRATVPTVIEKKSKRKSGRAPDSNRQAKLKAAAGLVGQGKSVRAAAKAWGLPESSLRAFVKQERAQQA